MYWVVTIRTIISNALFSLFYASLTLKICWFCICCIYLAERIFVEYSLSSGRVVSVFNFQIIQMPKFVYFLRIKKFHSRTLTTALVGIKIKCYLTFTHVPINFIFFLEIMAFQRLRMNIFTVKYIRTLHVQISIFRQKCTLCSYLFTVDVKNNEFVVANYLPIHIEKVTYRRFEHVPWKKYRPHYGECLSSGLFIYGF
jgi:hypothetical protein